MCCESQCACWHCPKTWTLLTADIDCLQAFHIPSLRRILEVRWFDRITNVEAKARSRLDDIELRIRQQRLALFEPVALMPPGPAYDGLQSALGVYWGNIPDPA